MAISEKIEDPLFRQKILEHGVMTAYGYGICPKSVCTDREISYESKCCYLLLSSLSGKGCEAYPSRETMLQLLCCGPFRLKNMIEPLIARGYVTVKSQRRVNGGQYSSNVYCINPNPPSLQTPPTEAISSGSQLHSLLKFEGSLPKGGYGFIPYAVFKDHRLGKNLIRAVALYGYILSYASMDGVAFPSVGIIQKDLQMSKVTYQQARNTLISCGYLSIVQRNWSDGQKGKGFGVNDVYIMNKLGFDEAEKKQVDDLSRHSNSMPVKSTSVKSMPVESRTVKSSLVQSSPDNSTTNNNNSLEQKQYSINTISPTNPQPPAAGEGQMDGIREKSLSDYEERIKEQIGYEDLLISHRSLSAETVDEYIRCAATACCRRKPTVINGVLVQPDELRKAFCSEITLEHFVFAIDRVAARSKEAEIKNVPAYFVATLFGSLGSLNTYYSAKVEYDMNHE